MKLFLILIGVASAAALTYAWRLAKAEARAWRDLNFPDYRDR